jgi:uncharacterized membrane protein YdbT with pleckstrin-like domain
VRYIEQLLGRDERILYVARQHSYVLVFNVIAELLLIAALTAAGVLVAVLPGAEALILTGSLSLADVVRIAALVLGAAVVISGVLDYLRWSSDQVVITDRRVIQARGILHKRITDSSLEKINDLELRQSLFGRMFNFGTISVLTASGNEGVNVIDRIEAPLEFQRTLLEAKHRYERGGAVDDVRSSDDARVLQELTNLYERGVLTAAEYEAKRQALQPDRPRR